MKITESYRRTESKLIEIKGLEASLFLTIESFNAEVNPAIKKHLSKIIDKMQNDYSSATI